MIMAIWVRAITLFTRIKPSWILIWSYARHSCGVSIHLETNFADKEDATNPSNTTTTSDLPDRTSTGPTSALPETTSTPSNNLNNASTGGAIEPLKDTEKTGVVAGHTGDIVTESSFSESTANPGATPSSVVAPESTEQAADKPSLAPKDDEIKDPKEEAEELMKKRDPNDHSGEPMKIHDGPERNEDLATHEARRDSKVGNPGGQELGKESKGTGEEWVKSSGLQADGGDFDATKPGAGREAESKSHHLSHGLQRVGTTLSRADGVSGLLEDKGVKKTSPVAEEASTTSGGSESGGEEKRSKMKKLKEKLHIGHKVKA